MTIVDLSDTWARAAIPETYADHIGYGDMLRVRLPGGTVTSGKVFFKGVEGGLRHAARCEPPQARHQDHRAEGPAGQSEGRVRSGHDRGSAGLAGTNEGHGHAERESGGAAMTADPIDTRSAPTAGIGAREADVRSNAPSAIEVEHIVKKYGDFTAVDDVSFSVKEGEIFGLLGPNGAGKSTLIRMMTTLIPITSGRRAIAGHDVAKEPDAARAG